MTLKIAATLALSMSSAAAAEAPILLSAATTGQLLESCERTSVKREANFCSGYILGVHDALSLSGAICPRPGVGTDQTLAIATKHLRDRPEQWDRAPSYLLSNAFTAAFPCKPRKGR